MHHVLLIDEIIQQIFELCYEEKNTLVQLARCCHAWKAPALDKIWRRLPCISPLIRLASSSSSNCLDPDNLYDYALKVKHIRFRSNPPDFHVLDAFLSSHHAKRLLLLNVTSVEVTADGCATPAIHLSLTPALKNVEIDIGVNTGRKAGVERSRFVADYLSAAATLCPTLETLRLRGFACEQLNSSISQLKTLRVLSLKVGNSFATDTMASIASFPLLEELIVHADRVDPHFCKTSTMLNQQVFFPFLRILRIRSRFALFEAILERIQSTTLNDLDMEIIDFEQIPAWKRLFTIIQTHQTMANTLERLKIDNHIELKDRDDDTPTPIGDKVFETRFTLDTISPLSKIPNLRLFILDTNLPPDLDDKGVDEVAKWWPHLEHLDLGIPPEDEDEGLAVKWCPKTTLACLETISLRCRKLQKLILTVDTTRAITHGQLCPIPQLSLRKLVITPSNIIDINTESYLRWLFPSLEEPSILV